MLTEEEKREIEASFRHYPKKSAASIEALKVVQRGRGWVSDETLKELAGFLEMSPEELDSVATFYDKIFRRPVGKRVVFLCDSVACWIMGSDRLREWFAERLKIRFGETSADRRFTLLPNACLGVCERAPAMMVGEDLFTGLDETRLGEVMERYGDG